MSFILEGNLFEQSAVAFDPITFGTPLWGMWAEDPASTFPGDGLPVIVNPNCFGSKSANYTKPGGNPLYVASAINGKPAVQTNDGDGFLRTTVGSAEAQITSLVAIVRPKVFTSNTVRVSDGGVTTPTTTRQAYIGRNETGSGGGHQVFAGTSQFQGSALAADTNYLVIVVYNGASTFLEVNGTGITMAGSPGTQAMQGHTIGADNSATLGIGTLQVNLCAVYDNDIRSDGGYSAFRSAALAYAGV